MVASAKGLVSVVARQRKDVLAVVKRAMLVDW
jgi:hypothetical protein